MTPIERIKKALDEKKVKTNHGLIPAFHTPKGQFNEGLEEAKKVVELHLRAFFQ